MSFVDPYYDDPYADEDMYGQMRGGGAPDIVSMYLAMQGGGGYDSTSATPTDDFGMMKRAGGGPMDWFADHIPQALSAPKYLERQAFNPGSDEWRTQRSIQEQLMRGSTPTAALGDIRRQEEGLLARMEREVLKNFEGLDGKDKKENTGVNTARVIRGSSDRDEAIKEWEKMDPDSIDTYSKLLGRSHPLVQQYRGISEGVRMPVEEMQKDQYQRANYPSVQEIMFLLPMIEALSQKNRK